MRKVKFILAVLVMALFTRPHRWEWEYRKLKEEHQRNKY
jgi:hypothetical protein